MECEDFVTKLRDVFDICDVNHEGYISVDHFIDLANGHFATADSYAYEDLSNIVNVLDNGGGGKISFEDFCCGVKKILQLSGPSTPTAEFNVPLWNENKFSITKNSKKVDDDAISIGTQGPSDISTYNEYDMVTDDDQSTVAIHEISSQYDYVKNKFLNGHEDDCDSAFSIASGIDNRLYTDITDDEARYEYFGEGDDFDSENESPNSCEIGKLSIPGISRRSSAFNSRNNSPYQRSRKSSFGSEGLYEDIDGSFIDLNNKVERLENQISQLTELQRTNDDRNLRMKDDNNSLIESSPWTLTRIHALEEEIKDVEARAQNRLKDEQRKHREILSRTDKEKSHDIEVLEHKLSRIEKDYNMLKEENPSLRAELERLKKENNELHETLAETQYCLSTLRDEHSHLQKRVHENRSNADHERDVNSELLDELTKELDELRVYKQEMDSKKLALQAVPKLNLQMLRKRELEGQIIRLKEECGRLSTINAKLVEENEDLQAQLMNQHIIECKTILQASSESFASEVQSLPRDQLMKALDEQKECNKKMREYVDNLIIRIMERNPSLLEVEQKENKPQSKIKKWIMKSSSSM